MISSTHHCACVGIVCTVEKLCLDCLESTFIKSTLIFARDQISPTRSQDPDFQTVLTPTDLDGAYMQILRVLTTYYIVSTQPGKISEYKHNIFNKTSDLTDQISPIRSHRSDLTDQISPIRSQDLELQPTLPAPADLVSIASTKRHFRQYRLLNATTTSSLPYISILDY